MSLITDIFKIKKNKNKVIDEDLSFTNFKKFKKNRSNDSIINNETATSTPLSSKSNEKNNSSSFTRLQSTKNKFLSKIKYISSPFNNSNKIDNNEDTCSDDFLSNILPENILKFYKEKKITSTFEWQKKCLNSGNVLEGENLIFSAPTSAGKSLVSDILMIKCVLKRKKKALLVLPYISLANEKIKNIEAMVKYTNIRVGGFMGNSLHTGCLPMIDIAVCTIEKANNIINRLIEDNKLEDLGLIIVDELHLLNDPHRGYLLELLLTKVKYMCKKNLLSIQILGMSATIPNLEEIASWLDACHFKTDYRPIPLIELIKIKSNILKVKTKEKFREIDDINIKIKQDPSFTLSLALETILSGNGVLIFCPTKDACEKNADILSQTINDLGMYNGDEDKYKITREKLYEVLKSENLKEVLIQLSKSPSKLDKTLARTISFGVAFHHAGLSINERDIIEAAFKNGFIKALFATPTLSSGVNLPARRVIISSIKIGISNLSCFTYKQMIGRAGRKGIDSKGESILICNEDEEKLAWQLTKKELSPIRSCLIDVDIKKEKVVFDEFLKRAILEIIAIRMVNDLKDVKEYLNQTFYAFSTKNLEKINLLCIINSLITNTSMANNKYLIQKIEDENGNEKYLPTRLGRGVLYSSLSPREAMKMFNELKSAMNGLVLNCDLHLLYQVVPNSDIENKNINWKKYFCFYSDIDNNDVLKNVADIIGISGAFINQAMMGKNIKNSVLKEKHVKFYYALALNEIITEVPLADVSDKYDINKGELQQLQQRSSSYCGMMSTFCRKLGWDSLAVIIKLFQDRLFFGINQDLIDLMNIPCLNGQMARCLFDSGYQDIKSIAHSCVYKIEEIFRNYEPFCVNEKDVNYKKFWISVRCESMNEKEIAKLIILEARSIVEDLAGAKINWENSLNYFDLKELKNTPEYKNNIDFNNVKITFFNEKLSQIKSQDEKKIIISCLPEISKCYRNDIPENKTFFEALAETKNLKINKKNFSIDQNKDFLDQTINEINNFSEKNRSEELFADELNFTKLTQNSSLILSTNNQNNNSIILSESDETILEETDLNKCPSSNNSEYIENRSQSLSPTQNLSEDLFSSNSQESIISNQLNQNFNENFNLLNEINTNKITDENFIKYLIELSNNICCLMNAKRFKLYVKVIDRSNIYSFILKWKTCKMFSISFKLEEKKFTKKLWNFKSVFTQDINFTFGKLDFIKKMCISFGTEMVYYIPDYLLIKSVIEYLNDFDFTEENVIAIAYESKICFKILAYCFNLKKKVLRKIIWHDPKIAAWILDTESDEPKSLFDLSTKYLDFLNYSKFHQKIFQLKKKDDQEKNELCFQNILNYLFTDKVIECLKKKNLYNCYFNIETPILFVFAKMEINGFTLDEEYLNNHITYCQNLLEKIETKVFKKNKINLNSTKDVKNMLYKDEIYSCKIREIISHDKNLKHLKIDKSVLEKLREFGSLPGYICDWRKINFFLNQSIEILNDFQNIDNEKEEKKIIGIYQHWISTGRVSMFRPNLLTISKDFNILIDGENFNFSLRKAFKPKNGYILVNADYCQLEFRILTALSQEIKLIEVFKKDLDIFKLIAKEITGKSLDEITNDERNLAKEICYSIIYGVGVQSLAKKLNFTENLALKFMNNFKNSFPRCLDFIEECKEDFRNTGFIKTLFGRIRCLPEINSDNFQTKSSAERKAINSIIQGSAADIVKLAMLRIDNFLENEKLEVDFLLQVHDELIFQVKNEEKIKKKFIKFLFNEMPKCGSILKTKLPIKVKTGFNWSELIEYNCSI